MPSYKGPYRVNAISKAGNYSCEGFAQESQHKKAIGISNSKLFWFSNKPRDHARDCSHLIAFKLCL